VKIENYLTKTRWLAGEPNMARSWNTMQKHGVDEMGNSHRILAK